MAKRTATIPAPAARTFPAGGDRADLTRRRILDAAAAAFAERGYAGTSLNELIKTTGLTKGGFYFHFPSKQALAVACVEHKKEQWLGRVMSEAMLHPRALDQLAAIPFILADLYEQDPTYGCIGKLCMELAGTDVAGTDPSFFTSSFSGWIQLTSSLIRRAQDEGDARTDLDPEVAGYNAVAAVVGITDMSTLMTGGADFRTRIEQFVPLFRAAISV